MCLCPQDVKTVAHMVQVNLKKYQVTSVDDALAVLEENGDTLPSESLKDSRGTASLDRGLSLSTRSGHAIQLSQKGKKDTLFFTLQVRPLATVGVLALSSSPTLLSGGATQDSPL